MSRKKKPRNAPKRKAAQPKKPLVPKYMTDPDTRLGRLAKWYRLDRLADLGPMDRLGFEAQLKALEARFSRFIESGDADTVLRVARAINSMRRTNLAVLNNSTNAEIGYMNAQVTADAGGVIEGQPTDGNVDADNKTLHAALERLRELPPHERAKHLADGGDP